MDEELERLVNTLIDQIECCICGSPIDIQASDLREQSEEAYTADYYCSGCDAGYDIEIQIIEAMISFDGYLKNVDKEIDVAEISRQTRKESLERQSHPAKSLVENTQELIEVLTVLSQNQKRIQEAANTLREDGIKQDDEFHRKVKADLHNYMASAYSFQEIVENIEPKIPTDSSVEKAENQFKEEQEIIKGLRTYAQHHLSLPFSISVFEDKNTGERPLTITVSLEDVSEFDYKDPEISYDKVDGDTINIERRVNLHLDAAEDLVEAMVQYVKSEYKEEIEDFHERTTYSEFE